MSLVKILYQLFLNVIFSVPAKVLQSIKRKSFERLNQLEKAGSKDSPTQSLSEDDLYCLDGHQLKNLLDKNIHFDFFQLDSVNENKQIKTLLKKARLKDKKEILSQLCQSQLFSVRGFSRGKKDSSGGEDRLIENSKQKENSKQDSMNKENFKKPVVLICKTGAVSKSFSRELRAKGFVNVYFIKKGFQSLLEDF